MPPQGKSYATPSQIPDIFAKNKIQASPSTYGNLDDEKNWKINSMAMKT